MFTIICFVFIILIFVFVISEIEKLIDDSDCGVVVLTISMFLLGVFIGVII